MQLKEGVDFYYDSLGYMVLTATYLRNRGNCCGNGCKHCPYEYEAVAEPKRSQLMAANRHEEKNSTKKD